MTALCDKQLVIVGRVRLSHPSKVINAQKEVPDVDKFLQPSNEASHSCINIKACLLSSLLTSCTKRL